MKSPAYKKFSVVWLFASLIMSTPKILAYAPYSHDNGSIIPVRNSVNCTCTSQTYIIAEASQSTKIGARKSASLQSRQFVPPPPPTKTLYFLNPNFSVLPSQFDLSSIESTRRSLNDVEKELAVAKGKLAEAEQLAKESKEKAERFAPLFTEGVVSRHELEAAVKESSETSQQSEQASADVRELEQERQALSDRLKPPKDAREKSNKSHSKKSSLSPANKSAPAIPIQQSAASLKR